MIQKTYKGVSPIEIPKEEKIVSITFPKETTSITTLDTSNPITVDVTACKSNFVNAVKETYNSNTNVTIIAPEFPNMNEIWYTSYDENIITPTTYNSNPFGTTLISNTYENGKGVMKFESKVTYIGQNAPVFYTSNLKSIVIPNSVTTIGDNAFLQCSGLTSITIPDSVTSIGYMTFQGCSNLTEISIPDSVTSIGYGAFYHCSGLTSITIPDGVTSIGDVTFSSCSSLTSITIPDGVTSIGQSTFSECSGLTSIQLPSNLTSIGQSTFSSCSNLIEISIPDSVTSIGHSAFANCIGLTSIIFNGTTDQWNAISKSSNWNFNVPTTCQVICTDGTISI